MNAWQSIHRNTLCDTRQVTGYRSGRLGFCHMRPNNLLLTVKYNIMAVDTKLFRELSYIKRSMQLLTLQVPQIRKGLTRLYWRWCCFASLNKLSVSSLSTDLPLNFCHWCSLHYVVFTRYAANAAVVLCTELGQIDTSWHLYTMKHQELFRIDYVMKSYYVHHCWMVKLIHFRTIKRSSCLV